MTSTGATSRSAVRRLPCVGCSRIKLSPLGKVFFPREESSWCFFGLNMISANFRLESDLRGWFNLEPETPHGRFKLDLESPKRRPDSTSKPTPVPKRPRKEVETCCKPVFESLLSILPISCYVTKAESKNAFQRFHYLPTPWAV